MNIPASFDELMDMFVGMKLVGWDSDAGTIYLDWEDGSSLAIEYDEEEDDICVTRLEPEDTIQ
jgi:hypothetical protein